MKCHLELQSVSFAYRTGKTFFSHKKKQILSGISLKIFPGETLGILGRNGAGKSTLLRILAGIFLPDSGNIIRNCQKINLLSLELGFSERLNGRQNIILSGLFNGFSKQEMQDKMPAIVAFSELGKAIEEPLLSYSSGMRARLGFSIAYHLQPDILLIDEILGVGDMDFQEKSEKLLKQKINSQQTVVLVTHDAKLVESVCQRAIWLDKGKIYMQGTQAEVSDRYIASKGKSNYHE
ncbi:MAG: ATP-binding cassette domain-containing protein [Spirochaetota bacterium]